MQISEMKIENLAQEFILLFLNKPFPTKFLIIVKKFDTFRFSYEIV